jgi:hypothetical protein
MIKIPKNAYLDTMLVSQGDLTGHVMWSKIHKATIYIVGLHGLDSYFVDEYSISGKKKRCNFINNIIYEGQLIRNKEFVTVLVEADQLIKIDKEKTTSLLQMLIKKNIINIFEIPFFGDNKYKKIG